MAVRYSRFSDTETPSALLYALALQDVKETSMCVRTAKRVSPFVWFYVVPRGMCPLKRAAADQQTRIVEGLADPGYGGQLIVRRISSRHERYAKPEDALLTNPLGLITG